MYFYTGNNYLWSYVRKCDHDILFGKKSKINSRLWVKIVVDTGMFPKFLISTTRKVLKFMKTLNKPDSEFLPSRQLKCDLNMSIPFSLCQELASDI